MPRGYPETALSPIPDTRFPSESWDLWRLGENLSDTPSTGRILLPMDFALQPHLYREVPVIYWPWVFWQLFKIALWCELTGREVMVAVAETGHVYVTRIGDDPSHWTAQTQPHLHEYYLTTRLPDESREQWRARIEAAYAPGFGVQAWIISPRALGTVVAQVCRPVRPAIRDPVLVPI